MLFPHFVTSVFLFVISGNSGDALRQCMPPHHIVFTISILPDSNTAKLKLPSRAPSMLSLRTTGGDCRFGYAQDSINFRKYIVFHSPARSLSVLLSHLLTNASFPQLHPLLRYLR